MSKKFKSAQVLFDDAPEDSRAFLKQFAFICMLSYDVYVKKLLIEKIIDGMSQENCKKQAGKKENKKQSKKETKNATEDES